MRCDEQLWYMRQMTVIDPKPKYMTDRYQVVQSNDGTIGIPHGSLVEDMFSYAWEQSLNP
jgi:hypothetical protein